MIADKCIFKCGEKRFIKGEKTLVMGVLNVTPDSFSDGGDFVDVSEAVLQGQKLIRDGADIIDVGGAATSPMSTPITVEEEMRRVIPVIVGLRQKGIANISVDTMNSAVAKQALLAGASWINDESAGLNDVKMAEVMVKADAVVIMHNGGGVASGVDAGEGVTYDNVISQLLQFFHARITELTALGVDPKKIIVDPGVGFGKGLKDSLTIINNMHRFNEFAMSLVGLSRKSFIGKMTGIVLPKERDFSSLGADATAIIFGANIIRTHNVKAVAEMAYIIDACSMERESHENLYKTRG